MTFERRMIAGIEDIKAVVFQCGDKKCKVRTTVPVDALREVPRACPSCNLPWNQDATVQHVNTSAGAPVALVQAIVTMRVLQREGKEENFKILFEFDEPTD
jgi:hypothetical protein